MTKWYWWVFLGIAVILTILVVVASWRTKSRKVEDKIVSSDPDLLSTAQSETYKTIARVTEMSINPSQAVQMESQPVAATTVKEMTSTVVK